MANYSIVSNAKFTPFSFEEMVKPFQMYGEFYTQQEQLASQLSEEADNLGQKANEATDPITYSKYKQFEEDLNKQADRILRQGITPGLRNDLQKLKKRFFKDVYPIKDAYTWKVSQMLAQAEGKSKGIVYEKDASTTSLDDYIANPTLIHSSADSTAGFTRLANAALAISKGLSEAKTTGKIDNYTKTLLVRSGYDVNDVNAAVAQAMEDIESVLNGKSNLNSKAGKIVQELLQNEANASGTMNWENKDAKHEYFSKVSPALYNLVGQSTSTPMEDFGARTTKTTDDQIKVETVRGKIQEKLQDKAHDNAKELNNQAFENEKKLIYLRSGLELYSNSIMNSATQSNSGLGLYKYSLNHPTYITDGEVSQYLGKDLEKVNLGKQLNISLNNKRNGVQDIEFRHNGKLIASYNVNESNKSNSIMYYSDNGKSLKATGSETLSKNSILEKITADDIVSFARLVKGMNSDKNQYLFGVDSSNSSLVIVPNAYVKTSGNNMFGNPAVVDQYWNSTKFNPNAPLNVPGVSLDPYSNKP